LETIIEKSFFPDLERLKVQKSYYDAVKNNNFDALRELYSKYNNLLTPSTKQDNSSNIRFIRKIKTLGFVLTKKNVIQFNFSSIYQNSKFNRDQNERRPN
jgi:hypothetical protein